MSHKFSNLSRSMGLTYEIEKICFNSIPTSGLITEDLIGKIRYMTGVNDKTALSCLNAIANGSRSIYFNGNMCYKNLANYQERKVEKEKPNKDSQSEHDKQIDIIKKAVKKGKEVVPKEDVKNDEK